MASKDFVAFDRDSGDYRILYKDAKTGEERVRETIHLIDAVPEVECIQLFQGLVSKLPNKRAGAITLQARILSLSSADLEPWKGKENKKTGQLSKELKDQFRKAEDKYFDQFMNPQHPMHKSYIARLPKLNEKGLPIEQTGVENITARHIYFVSSMRSDPSYAQAKNLTLSLWGFVGKSPWVDNKETSIIPPEAMRVMVAAAKDVQPADNSYTGRLIPMLKELFMPADPDKPVDIPADRLNEVLSSLQRAADAVKERINIAAAQATEAHAAQGDVVTQTKDSIAAAAGKREATAPSDGAKVAPAEHQ